jgi:hypothetical protein
LCISVSPAQLCGIRITELADARSTTTMAALHSLLVFLVNKIVKAKEREPLDGNWTADTKATTSML